MKLVKYVGRSIGLKQAVAVLLASLVIGLGLSALQLGNALTEQREEGIELSQKILTMAEGTAARAAWTLDPRLAEEVVNSVIAVGGVQRAQIVDEEGTVFADARSEDVERGPFVSWFARAFLRGGIRGQRQLMIKIFDESRIVGALTVELAPHHIANRFVTLAMTAVATRVVEALLIGLLLLWLSSLLVTAPLHRVAKSIAEINPDRPEAMVLEIPRSHENDELGHLLHRTNQMLTRLAGTQVQLRNLATRDALTNLPNRVLITENLQNAILRAKRNGTKVAVLFLDLDRFKNINDFLGHNVGDDLLAAVAGKLTKKIRANDAVGRLGGDEFLIVLEDIHHIEEVVRTAERIARALREPLFLGTHEARVTASIGIAVYPDDAEDAGTLMRQADLAMYHVKGSGGAQWHFFTKEMSDRMESRVWTETALSRALDRNELALFFQPKIGARSGRVAGCEALLRWKRADKLLTGDSFISVAEETGIIIEIGDWVLHRACRQIKDWARRIGPIPISVNVSARQLRERNFAAQVLAAIRLHQIDASLLELEITETVLIEDFERNLSVLGQLRNEGVTISIDDFGTGYSSLSYLTRLPINALKIDKSFVSGSQSSKDILRTVIAMAKTLPLVTVAEGVETREQRDWLMAEGCDLLQGYLISEPLDADELERTFLNVSTIPLSRSADRDRVAQKR